MPDVWNTAKAEKFFTKFIRDAAFSIFLLRRKGRVLHVF